MIAYKNANMNIAMDTIVMGIELKDDDS